MRTTKLVAASVLTLAALSATTVAHAAPNISVTAGTLDYDGGVGPSFSAFKAITLNGQPQLTSASLDPFTVIDATGSSAGWHVTIDVSNLVNGSSTISKGQIWMTQPVVTGASDSDPSAFTLDGIDLGDLTGGAVTMVSAPAALNSGGTFMISPMILKVVVPGNALAGTYTATGTVTLATGP